MPTGKDNAGFVKTLETLLGELDRPAGAGRKRLGGGGGGRAGRRRYGGRR